MKSESEVEQLLQQLGHDWPFKDSFVDRVMRDIESQTILPKLPGPRFSLKASWAAIVAAMSIVAALWLSSRSSGSLYAQVVDGIKQARTIHSIRTIEATSALPKKIVDQSWYERGVGFRNEFGDEVRVGNQNDLWTFAKDGKFASRSRSPGIDDFVNRMLNDDVFRRLDEQQFERYPAEDQKIDGRLCRAFLGGAVKSTNDPDWQNGKKRAIVLVDERSRIVRSMIQKRTDEQWLTESVNEWKYDEPFDQALFQPRFGSDVKIVDADSLFTEMTNLEQAVYREERSGLWYAIHHAERCQNGAIFIVSSVRGTEDTLKEFPLVQRTPFFLMGPATNYDASPQGDRYLRINLASADHQGVEVRWWLLEPRSAPPTVFQRGPDRVKIPAGITPRGEFAKAKCADERGVIHHLTWDITLTLPEPKEMSTLDAVARRTYADRLALDAIPAGTLDQGLKENVGQHCSPRETTADQFSKAVADHVRWWHEQDIEFQLSGRFANRSVLDEGHSSARSAIGLAYESLVDDATLARVSQRKGLKQLYLTGTNVTDAGLVQLLALDDLEELDLAETSITDVGLKTLGGLKSLQRLGVKGTKVTNDGIQNLQLSKPALTITH